MGFSLNSICQPGAASSASSSASDFDARKVVGCWATLCAPETKVDALHCLLKDIGSWGKPMESRPVTSRILKLKQWLQLAVRLNNQKPKKISRTCCHCTCSHLHSIEHSVCLFPSVVKHNVGFADCLELIILKTLKIIPKKITPFRWVFTPFRWKITPFQNPYFLGEGFQLALAPLSDVDSTSVWNKETLSPLRGNHQFSASPGILDHLL